MRARLAAAVWSWPLWLQVAGGLLLAFCVGAVLGAAVGGIVLAVEMLAAGALAESSRSDG